MTFAGGIIKQDNKQHTATMTSWSAILNRGRNISAAVAAWSAVVSKQSVNVFLAVPTIWAAALMRGRNFAATAAVFAGIVTRTSLYPLTASPAAWAATLAQSHLIIKALAGATATFAAAIVKQVRRIIAAS